MKFSAWVDYPSMSIAIQIVDGKFKCVKYVGNRKVHSAEKICSSLDELKDFLESLPYPPKQEIEEILDSLISNT